MTDLRDVFSKYTELASSVAKTMRKTAEGLELGELPASGTGERIASAISQLETMSHQLREHLEPLGVDVSDAHTVEDLERTYRKLVTDQVLEALDSLQDITASEEKYAVPMEQLQKRAAQTAQDLRRTEDFPSDGSLRVAEQGTAILNVLDSDQKEQASREGVFESLGISDTILLGLVLGKYHRRSSDGEGQTAADDTEREETKIPETSAIEGSQNPDTENHDESETESDGTDSSDSMVRSLGKLRDREPNARRFLRALRSCDPLAKAVVSVVYYDDVVTVSQVVSSIRSEMDFPITPKIVEDLHKAARRLVQHGILAAYKVQDEVLYLFTRFGLESLKKPAVQHALGFTRQRPADQPEIIAEDEMPLGVLVMRWVWNELHARVDDWLRREIGQNLPDNWDGDRNIDHQYALKLPPGYGHRNDVYIVRPYEGPRIPEVHPILYVVLTDDTAPHAADIDEDESSLLLYEGALYERKDGRWVKMAKSLPDAAQSSMKKNRKRKK